MLTSADFRGAFTAIVTPFSEDGSAIDYGRLAAQIEFQAKGEDGKGGVRGIVVSGTTGESPTLSEREYRELVNKAVELGKARGLIVIAGTGSNSTHHAVEMQRFAKSAGADATLSVNPYYNKPVQAGLVEHFFKVAEAAEIPVVLYNIPGRTGVALTPETVEKIAGHPNVRAIKEATGSTDSCGEIALRCPGIAVLSGDDTMTLPFASVGAVGVVSVVSNLLPGKIARLCAAFLEGRWSDALKVHRELIPIAKGMFIETNPIPVKAAMAMLGRDSGALRLPMTRAAEGTVKVLRGLGLR
ncbi:4-hydroxy-tetrahydrodipicolinate synthase [soil metagenome]